jgi:hypothetical protein
LEATETKYISLEKLILMELEINRRDLTNRVKIGFPEESEKFCTLDEISFEKSLLVGVLKNAGILLANPYHKSLVRFKVLYP